ncbi:hypothetical protein Efla_003661 [Eimeria flavescens]
MRRDRSCTLNVSSLSRNVKESHLREVFGLYGVIRSCEIAIDRKADIPKGYAYVEFDSQREAENALRHLHGGVLDGKVLRVELSSKTHERHQGKAEARPQPQSKPAAVFVPRSTERAEGQKPLCQSQLRGLPTTAGAPWTPKGPQRMQESRTPREGTLSARLDCLSYAAAPPSSRCWRGVSSCLPWGPLTLQR